MRNHPLLRHALSDVRPDLSHNVPTDAIPSASCILPTALCNWTSQAPFLTSVAFWASLQLTWTSILLIGQLWQVMKQVTTFEVSNLSKFGFMGGRGHGAAGQDGLVENVKQEQAMAEEEPSADGISQAPSHHHAKHPHKSSTAFLLQLLGLDRFSRASERRALVRSSRNSNPFDQGVYRNCVDFWTSGKELGVEYGRLYDVPNEGFVKHKAEAGRKGKGRGTGYEALPTKGDEEV